MSVIAPKFRLGHLIKGITDNIFWIIVLVTLIAIPVLQIVLIYIDFPIIDGEIWNPFRVLDAMTHPERALPLVKSFMQTDLFKVVAFPGFGFAALLAAAVIFVERKMLAKLQLRVGPFYCGKVEGILQLMGDGLKLISKEIIIPAKADKPLFWAAPVLFAATAAAFVALIPVAPGWVVADIDLGLLAVFAVIGFFPIITIVSAWSANSKFPFIGGIRALFQMVSFEIPLILSLLGIVMLTGTLDLVEIVESQANFPWIIFMPIGAVVFFICILAELERIPFDLPEAESEIVAGWLTEFSGMMYGLVQLGSYLKLYAFAGLFVVLFLGGWTGPVIVPPFPAEIVTDGITIMPDALTVEIPGLPLFTHEMINGTIWFILKTVGVIFFILLPRGVFPRVRIDLLLKIGWYKLIVLAFVGIIKALNSGIKHIAIKRFTFRYPEQKLKFVGDGYQYDPSSGVGIAGYKGRHILFHDKCTGCQLCSIACEDIAEAIAMPKVEEEWKHNKKAIMPQIDYGKCVFCGLCVDACPFYALYMTNDYELSSFTKEGLIYTPAQLQVKPQVDQDVEIQIDEKGAKHG